MRDTSSLWLFAAPLVPVALLVGWLSDMFETPRPVREKACRTAIVHACDQGQLDQIRPLLREWKIIRRDSSRPNEGLIIISSTTMTANDKLSYIKHLAQQKGGDKCR